MIGKHFLFVGGLHRSGTSLLHEILRSHPQLSGFANTGVPEDEGQHLQTVYPPARAFGGPGRFGFDAASSMDERHPLATADDGRRLFEEWSRFWDTTKQYLIEKSPPNLVRTRFLQQVFPNSSFIVILRHPIAVAYATRKWCNDPVASLLDHGLCCYERFRRDMDLLRKVYVLRYEDFVQAPQSHVDAIFEWIGVPSIEIPHQVRSDVNRKYFALWNADRASVYRKLWGGFGKLNKRLHEFERRANAFGYSVLAPDDLSPSAVLGPHELLLQETR